MKLRFLKVNPSGNTTVFVLDPVPREQYTRVAGAIMQQCNVGAEQVGFIIEETGSGTVRMDMAGGEFCGNASRSFAAWLALRDESGLAVRNFREKECKVAIHVSGHKGILEATLGNLGADNKCLASVSMPIPEQILHGEDDYFGRYSIVIFEGISHFVLWERVPKDGDIEAARAFLTARSVDSSSFGIMYYRLETCFMCPVVYIDAAQTLVWENSCGSGSCALAASLADQQQAGISALTLHQPGGDLTVHVDWDQGVKGIVLSGVVEITAIGIAYID
jgi:diaminopimelate epimerase